MLAEYRLRAHSIKKPDGGSMAIQIKGRAASGRTRCENSDKNPLFPVCSAVFQPGIRKGHIPSVWENRLFSSTAVNRCGTQAAGRD